MKSSTKQRITLVSFKEKIASTGSFKYGQSSEDLHTE